MSYEFYRLLHLVGLMAVFLSLGGTALQAMARADHQGDGDPPAPTHRGLVASVHGLGLLVMLISGFGILAKAKLGFPGWVHGKLAIWLALGAAPVLLKRKPQLAKPLFFLLLVLGFVAAYLAGFKPGA